MAQTAGFGAGRRGRPGLRLVALLLLWPLAGAALAGPGAREPGGEAGGAAGEEEAAADVPRAGLWRKLREEKRKRLEAPRANRVERFLLALEKGERPSFLNFNVMGLYPQLTSINKDSRTAAGVRFWQPDLGGLPLDFHASALLSVRDYKFLDAQFGSIPHAGRNLPLQSTRGDDVFELGGIRTRGYRKLILYGSARYRYYPEERFFGLGTDSRRRDRTSFLLEDTLYEAVAGVQLSRRVALTVRAGYLDVEVRAGKSDVHPPIQERFDDAEVPGVDEQPDFLQGTAQLFLDYRDEALNPHRGWMVALAYSRFDDRGGHGFEFDRYGLDARAYLPLGSDQRVLALRLFGSTAEADRGARVPFYLDETLGGSHTLRAYRSLRFRGPTVLALQAEYRWETISALELALFFDAGKAVDDLDRLTLGDMRTDYGIGVRFKAPQRVVLRFDLARSSEATILRVRFGPSF